MSKGDKLMETTNIISVRTYVRCQYITSIDQSQTTLLFKWPIHPISTMFSKFMWCADIKTTSMMPWWHTAFTKCFCIWSKVDNKSENPCWNIPRTYHQSSITMNIISNKSCIFTLFWALRKLIHMGALFIPDCTFHCYALIRWREKQVSSTSCHIIFVKLYLWQNHTWDHWT